MKKFFMYLAILYFVVTASTGIVVSAVLFVVAMNPSEVPPGTQLDLPEEFPVIRDTTHLIAFRSSDTLYVRFRK